MRPPGGIPSTDGTTSAARSTPGRLKAPPTTSAHAGDLLHRQALVYITPDVYTPPHTIIETL